MFLTRIFFSLNIVLSGFTTILDILEEFSEMFNNLNNWRKPAY